MNIQERMLHYHVAGLSIAYIHHYQMTDIQNYGLLEAETDKQVNNHTIFSACSMSKFLTAMLVAKLSSQFVLDLDEDVNKRLSAWQIRENESTKDKSVTLRSLLSHQSGIIDPDGSFTELNRLIGYRPMTEILEGKTLYCPTPIEVSTEPGSAFHYSDAGYCIIQQLLEDVLEKPFHSMIKEHIFDPLKMDQSIIDMKIAYTDDCSTGHNKDGTVVKGKYPIYPYPAAAGLWTTSSDFAALVIELMNSLQGKSTLGLSPIQANEVISMQGGKDWTGLGVFLDHSGNELEISSLGWGAGFQCMMTALPHSGNGLVIMTNTELGVHQMKGLIGEIYQSWIGK